MAGPSQGYASPAASVWPLPFEDLTTQVRVVVSDASGGTAANVSASFRIDTGPPFIGARATLPLDGAVDVPANTPITISFSEAMNHTSVETAISLQPPFPLTTFTWPADQTIRTVTGATRAEKAHVTPLDA